MIASPNADLFGQPCLRLGVDKMPAYLARLPYATSDRDASVKSSDRLALSLLPPLPLPLDFASVLQVPDTGYSAHYGWLHIRFWNMGRHLEQPFRHLAAVLPWGQKVVNPQQSDDGHLVPCEHPRATCPVQRFAGLRITHFDQISVRPMTFAVVIDGTSNPTETQNIKVPRNDLCSSLRTAHGCTDGCGCLHRFWLNLSSPSRQSLAYNSRGS